MNCNYGLQSVMKFVAQKDQSATLLFYRLFLVTLTYGSCISTAYKTYLGCDEIFSSSSVPATQLVNAFTSDIQSLMDNGIEAFSQDAARTVRNFLKNENDDLDNLRIVEEVVMIILRNTNQSLPSNVAKILTKLDTLILTAILNISEVGEASKDLLSSFENLNTRDEATSNLLYELFTRNGITVPIEFTHVIENLPGFIAQYVNNNPSYQMFNQSMFLAISSIHGSNISSTVSALTEVARTTLPGIVNSDFDILPIVDAVSNLTMQLINGMKILDLDFWRLNLLKTYSKTTSISRSLSAAMINFISNIVGEQQLSEGWVTLLNYIPGYLYMFTNDTLQLDQAFVALTNYLNIYEESNLNPTSILNSSQLNLSSIDVEAYIEFALSVIDASANVTSFVRTSNETDTFIKSLLSLLTELNIVVPKEYHSTIQNIPRLLVVLLNQQRTNDIVTKELLNILTSGDLSLNSSILMLSNMIPTEYNLQIFISSLPRLINELRRGNWNYINQWHADVIKTYGKTTEATKSFSNAIFEYLKISGIFELVTPELKTMIEYYPGYLFNFFPPEIVPQIDSVLYNISEALISNSHGISMSLSDTLQAYSINTSDPALLGVVRAIDSILNLSRARNITELGREALASLKQVSFRTNQTSSFIASFRGLLHSMNITIPSEYDEVLDYTPGMILSFIPGSKDDVNNIFENISAYISAFDMSNPNFDSIFEVFATMIPQEYNLNRFLKSLSPLLSQFAMGNFQYVNEWQIQVLIDYSNITAATEAVTNSTFELFKREGLFGYLPDIVMTLIRYYPGYIYNFIPKSQIPQFELALYQIADTLGMSQTGNQVNIENILKSFGLNTSEPALQTTVTVLQRVMNLGSSRNNSELGFQALKSLQETSVTNNDTAALSASFLNFLESYNVSIPVEYEEVTRQVPGVFVTLFPQYEEIISQIFRNASLMLNDFDINSYDATFLMLGMLIPAEYNLQILIESFPALLGELTAGNIPYLNTWQLHLLKQYSKVTPATQNLANATFDFIERVGYTANLTSDINMLINNVPGHLYNFVPQNMIGQLELAFYNISDILYLNDGNYTVSTSAILQSFSLNTSDPVIVALTAIMDSIFNVANANNITELGMEASKSLQSVANITDESKIYSDSFIQFLGQFNITIPNDYQDVTQSVAGLLAVILPHQREMINNIFLNASKILDASLANGTNLEAAIEILQSVTPAAYNLHLFMDTLPTLISQLTAGNFLYIYQWQSDVINAYSINTPATESFWNSTVGFLTRAGLYDHLPDYQKSSLSNSIGYIYYFIPEHMTKEFESVLLNASEILKVTDPGQNIDFQEIFASFSFNVTDPRVQNGLTLINSITNLATVTNLTEFGLQALESLEGVSVRSNGTKMLSDSILKIVRLYIVNVTDEYGTIIENSLGLFNGLFQEQRALINGIFLNVAQSLNLSDPSYQSLTVLNTIIPKEYNIAPFIDSIPSLLGELTQENFAYINEWSANLIKSYSNVTDASEQLTASLMQLLDICGLRNNVTSELETFVQYFPGLIYTVIPKNMTQRLDFALSNAASMLNVTDPNVKINILNILDSYSINISDAGLRKSLSSLDSILSIARSQTLNQFAEQSLASMKMFSTVTNQTSDLSEAIIEFLEKLNVSPTSEYQDSIRHIPGLLVTMLPNQREVLSSIFVNMSQVLQSFNFTQTDFEPIITLIQGLIPAEYNLNKLLTSLPSLLDALLSGNWNYINVWQINLLVEYSSITPASTALANATIQLLDKWNLYDSLDQGLQTLINYYPGYFYQILPPELIPQYELALHGITQTLSVTDPNSNVTIRQIFETFAFNQTSPGIKEIVDLLSSLSNVATARNLTDFGKQALLSLRNVAEPTNTTHTASLALYQLLQRFNLPVSEEYFQVIFGTTTVLISAIPEKSDEVSSLLMNISSILDQTDPMNPNFTAVFDDIIKLVPEEYNIGILLKSIAELLSQLLRGNVIYVNTWQLNILKSYSKVTQATESIYNSTISLMERLGLKISVPEEIFTSIKYYPGYFYNFVGNNSAILDTVLYTISESIDMIMPTNAVDIQALLASLNENFTTSAESQLILGLNNIVNVSMSGNLTDFRDGLVQSLRNIAPITNTSQLLSKSLMAFFVRSNVTYGDEYEVLLTHVPAMFIAFFPEHRDVIDALYLQTASNFDSFNASSIETTDTLNTSFAIQQIFNNTLNQLEVVNVSMPAEIIGLVHLLQSISQDVVEQQGSIEEWIAKLPVLEEHVSNSSMMFSSAINQLWHETSNLSNNEILSMVMQYLPKIFYLSHPDNNSSIDAMFEIFSETLHSKSMDGNQLLLNMTNDLLKDIPPELRQLVFTFRDLIPALLSNNQSAMNQWVTYVTTQHCSSNKIVVNEYAKVMTKSLEMLGLTVPEYTTNAFKCIPEMIYNLMPNQSEIVDNALRLGVLAQTNYSAYAKEMAKMLGFDLTSQFNPMLDIFPNIQSALLTFNMTEVTSVLLQFQKAMSQNSQIGNLTMEVLSRFGLDLTDETNQILQQVLNYDIVRMLSTLYPSIDVYISSMASNLKTGDDFETAFINAFSSVNVTLSPRYIPLFSNIEALIGGMVKNDMNMINQAVLNTLIAYNTSFPSYEVAYVINQYKLQLILQNVNSTYIPEDAFLYLENMYHLFLKMSNLSEEFLRNSIIEAYPSSKATVDVMFQLQPKDSFRFIYNATVWIFSSERNVSVLARHIKTIIDIFFQGQDFNVADLLISLSKPM